MNLEELLLDYFKSAYRKYPNLQFTFPENTSYSGLANCLTEVKGMYFIEVVVNQRFMIPCIVQWKSETSVAVYMDHKRAKELKQYLKR